MVTEQQIRELAYSIWEEEGYPEGKDQDHYFRAKQILEEQQSSLLIEMTPSPTPRLAPLIDEAPPARHKHRKHTRFHR